MRSDPLQQLKELSPELFEEISQIISDLNDEINELEVEVDLASGNRKRPRKKFDDEA